tara:strand:+ start:493 stop:777 length:285 start_codon:yes stop_codon:yes gene_type:complete
MPKLLAINTSAFKQNHIDREDREDRENRENESNLNWVELESIEVIGVEAFRGNLELETLRLPSCIKYIGKDAFADCDNLTDVVVEGVDSAVFGR